MNEDVHVLIPYGLNSKALLNFIIYWLKEEQNTSLTTLFLNFRWITYWDTELFDFE